MGFGELPKSILKFHYTRSSFYYPKGLPFQETGTLKKII